MSIPVIRAELANNVSSDEESGSSSEDSERATKMEAKVKSLEKGRLETKDFTTKIKLQDKSPPFDRSVVVNREDLARFPGDAGRGKTILAVHILGDMVAFAEKRSRTKPADIFQGHKIHGFHLLNNQSFCLGEMREPVSDLAFSRLFDRLILGAVDEAGNIKVFEVLMSPLGKRSSSVLLSIACEASATVTRKLAWCPFVPEEGEEEDEILHQSLFLATTQGKSVDLLDVKNILEKYGHGSELSFSDILEFRVQIAPLNRAVSWVNLSVDGTIASLVLESGEVLFHNMESMNSVETWMPGDDEYSRVSGIWFLDDYSQRTSDDVFWKFALVGLEDNTVLKLYDLRSWNPLQIIRLQPKGNKFELSVDPGSKYFVLSDLDLPRLFVFQLTLTEPGRGEETTLKITCLREVGLASVMKSIVARNTQNSDFVELFGLKNSGLEFMKICIKSPSPSSRGDSLTDAKLSPIPRKRVDSPLPVFLKQPEGLKSARAEESLVRGRSPPKAKKTEEKRCMIPPQPLKIEQTPRTPTPLPEIQTPVNAPLDLSFAARHENNNNHVPSKGPEPVFQTAAAQQAFILQQILDEMGQFRGAIKAMQSEHEELKKKVIEEGNRATQGIQDSLRQFETNVMKTIREEMPKNAAIVAGIAASMESVFSGYVLPELEQRIVSSLRSGEATNVVDEAADVNAGEQESALERKRQDVRALIEAGNGPEALEKALSSQDQDLILKTCNEVDFTGLLRDGQLGSLVLLSLVHFLGKGLATDTREKCGYIQEVLVNLDEEDDFARDNLADVKKELKVTLRKVLEIYKVSDLSQWKELKLLEGLCN